MRKLCMLAAVMLAPLFMSPAFATGAGIILERADDEIHSVVLAHFKADAGEIDHAADLARSGDAFSGYMLSNDDSLETDWPDVATGASEPGRAAVMTAESRAGPGRAMLVFMLKSFDLRRPHLPPGRLRLPG